MSLLRLLGLQRIEDSPSQPNGGDTETVRKIVRRLAELEPDRARFVAAFAYVLGRVAHADSHISDEETASMERLVREHGRLPEDQAVLVVEIAKSQNRLFGGTENYLVTRELREITSDDQRREILECLFAVSAADESISTVEEAQIRQISSELGFTHAEYVEVRSRFSQHREVLKNRPGSDSV